MNMVPYEKIRDLLGRPVIDPYPELNDFRANPILFWLQIQKDYEELPRKSDVFYNMLTTEFLVKHDHEFLEEAVRSPAIQEDGWTFSWKDYYIPVPDRPLLIRLKCREDYTRTLYFKATAEVDDESVEYLDRPSISTFNREFYAYEIEQPENKWAERILGTNRRREMLNGKHHNQVKPYDETQALYKCVPGKTYLIQDCYWGQALGNGVPEMKANKQVLVMSDGIFQAQLPAAQ